MRPFGMAWFQQLTLGQKFLTSFGLLLVLLGLSLVAILFYLARINSYVERHNTITVPAVVTAADMRQNLFHLHLALISLDITHSSEERAQIIQRFPKRESILRAALESYRITHAARTNPILFRMLADHGRVDLVDREEGTLAETAKLLDDLSSKLAKLTMLLEKSRLEDAHTPLVEATDLYAD